MGPPGWWIDEDLIGLLPVLTRARRKFGDIHGPGAPGCPPRGSKDVEWIEWVGARGYAVLTRDVTMKKTRAEREALARAGLGAFFLRARAADTWEQLRLVTKYFDTMRKTWSETPRPFHANLTRSGVRVDARGPSSTR